MAAITPVKNSFNEPPPHKYITTDVAKSSNTILKFGWTKISPIIAKMYKYAFKNFDLTKIRASLQKADANSITTAGFANSEGCNCINPMFIQRFAPLTKTPNGVASTKIRATNIIIAYIVFHFESFL